MELILDKDNIPEAIEAWKKEELRKNYALDFKVFFEGVISNNTKFSREDLFDHVFLHRRVINAFFIPFSESYERYGEYVTVISVEMDDAEKESLAKSVWTKNSTFLSITLKIMRINGTMEIAVVNPKDIYLIEMI